MNNSYQDSIKQGESLIEVKVRSFDWLFRKKDCKIKIIIQGAHNINIVCEQGKPIMNAILYREEIKVGDTLDDAKSRAFDWLSSVGEIWIAKIYRHPSKTLPMEDDIYIEYRLISSLQPSTITSGDLIKHRARNSRFFRE